MTPEVLTNEQLKALTVEACILKSELLNSPGDYKKSLESLIGIIGDITDRLAAEVQRREAAEAVLRDMKNPVQHTCMANLWSKFPKEPV